MTLESDLSAFLVAYDKLWDTNEMCPDLCLRDGVDANYLRQVVRDIRTQDRCMNCGKLIDGEEQTTIRQKDEFWGAPCYQEIVTGYICSYCNHKEMF
jgi:hypothetical protein